MPRGFASARFSQAAQAIIAAMGGAAAQAAGRAHVLTREEAARGGRNSPTVFNAISGKIAGHNGGVKSAKLRREGM